MDEKGHEDEEETVDESSADLCADYSSNNGMRKEEYDEETKNGRS